jgi:DNA-binding HxlR family transcriptional regulator
MHFSHTNSNDSYTLIKRMSDLERENVMFKKKFDEKIPSYNIKHKLDSHAHNIALCFKKKDIPQLKRDIREAIMSELEELGIINREEIEENQIEENEEEEEETETDPV